jgi:hypothetical protein
MSPPGRPARPAPWRGSRLLGDSRRGGHRGVTEAGSTDRIFSTRALAPGTSGGSPSTDLGTVTFGARVGAAPSTSATSTQEAPLLVLVTCARNRQCRPRAGWPATRTTSPGESPFHCSCRTKRCSDRAAATRRACDARRWDRPTGGGSEGPEGARVATGPSIRRGCDILRDQGLAPRRRRRAPAGRGGGRDEDGGAHRVSARQGAGEAPRPGGDTKANHTGSMGRRDTALPTDRAPASAHFCHRLRGVPAAPRHVDAQPSAGS